MYNNRSNKIEIYLREAFNRKAFKKIVTNVTIGGVGQPFDKILKLVFKIHFRPLHSESFREAFKKKNKKNWV